MRLKYAKDNSPVSHPADCGRIVSVLSSAGFSVSLHEAERLWEAYSETYCAGWLMLPNDDTDIINALTEE